MAQTHDNGDAREFLRRNYPDLEAKARQMTEAQTNTIAAGAAGTTPRTREGRRIVKHARDDYNQRVQDAAGLIPEDEPVFLLPANVRVITDPVE